MTKDRILLSLNPDFRKCPKCNKYFHVKKSQIFYTWYYYYGSSMIQINCILCHFPNTEIKFFMEYQMGKKETIESIYGDLYKLKRGIITRKYFLKEINK